MANKNRKCKYCRKYHPREKMLSNKLGFYCCKEHMIEDAVRSSQKLTQKGFKERQRNAKERLKTKREWLSEAQAAFNKYIRVRDSGKPCISCGKPDDGSHQRHASHFRSVGAAGQLRFHPLNVHASCAQCNGVMSGNLLEYRIRLPEKIGHEWVEWLCNNNDARGYTIDEAKRIKSIYTKKASLYKRRFRT